MYCFQESAGTLVRGAIQIIMSLSGGIPNHISCPRSKSLRQRKVQLISNIDRGA
jgi:hypothetical protein